MSNNPFPAFVFHDDPAVKQFSFFGTYIPCTCSENPDTVSFDNDRAGSAERFSIPFCKSNGISISAVFWAKATVVAQRRTQLSRTIFILLTLDDHFF